MRGTIVIPFFIMFAYVYVLMTYRQFHVCDAQLISMGRELYYIVAWNACYTFWAAILVCVWSVCKWVTPASECQSPECACMNTFLFCEEIMDNGAC